MRSYRDLVVWQEAIELVEVAYQLAKQLPPEEKFGLVSQLQRAAVSVPANIAEGAARDSTKDFLRHCIDSPRFTSRSQHIYHDHSQTTIGSRGTNCAKRNQNQSSWSIAKWSSTFASHQNQQATQIVFTPCPFQPLTTNH